jgi:hypothetical protein
MRAFAKLPLALFAILCAASFLMYTATATNTAQDKAASESLRTSAMPPPPLYQIYDIGVVQVGDSASQGFGVSTTGIAVGRSIRTGGAQAFSWTQGGGIVGLPNLAARPFCVSNSANGSGVVVGTCATTLFGSSRLPVIWQAGVVSQLPLPAGETLGDANDINASGVAVGSVDGGSLQQAVVYSGANATVITQTTANGCFFVTAFGVNDSGRVVGTGIDPNNAARNVGIVYDIGNASAFEVGALPGANGALAFGISNSGYVVGSSMMNQGSGLPFRWSPAGGMEAVPLPTGTTQGSARAVNSSGWVVGTASSAFAIPFVFDGSSTYRLADLIPPGTGWDLSTNTSSSALGISEDNVIVGTGVFNGQVHAYAMVQEARPAPFDFYGSGRSSFANTVAGQGGNFVWRLRNNGGAGADLVGWGFDTDLRAAADYDGDGRTDIGVFRNGVWYLLRSQLGAATVQFGQAGDIPVPSDYTGDGQAEVAVYRSGSWYMLNLSNNQVQSALFGLAGDRPVPADYDGDRKNDLAVFRDGVWYWLRSSDNESRGVQFGLGSDKPMTGDYDGDGRADQTVFRSGAWYVLGSTQGFSGVQFGLAGDIPLVGDYNGDGQNDIAVYRPTSGTYYWLDSPTNTTFHFLPHGGPSDFPVAGQQ